MFLQRLERLIQEYEANIQDKHAHIKDAKTEKASELQAVTPYMACKWVTTHGVTPREWSLLGTKRD